MSSTELQELIDVGNSLSVLSFYPVHESTFSDLWTLMSLATYSRWVSIFIDFATENERLRPVLCDWAYRHLPL